MAGGLLAWAGMSCAHKVFGPPGISLCGGVLHNIGQILAAALLFRNKSLFAYLPWLVISGAICGFLLGWVGQVLLRRLH
jgi:heptaprenyl diphosphate synthase